MVEQPLPIEIVEKILTEIMRTPGDMVKPALLAVSELSKAWALLSRPHLFHVLVLKGENDTLELLRLMEEPHSTFPAPIRCETFILKSSTMGGTGVSALEDVARLMITPNSLEIHALHGGISGATIRAFGRWANLRQLGVSGGAHTPLTFFNQLRVFPQLESLNFHNFRFNIANESAQARYSFPSNIIRLSLFQSSSIWVFLGPHVVTGGGFDTVQELHIQAQVCYQAQGVREMVACFRQLRHVHTLELDTLYNTHCPDLRPTMRHIFASRSMPALRNHGLKNLRLNFTRVPAEFTFSVPIMTTIYLPFIQSNLAVDITLPQSSGLWDNADPDAQLRQTLVETRPGNAPDLHLESSITVRGFPGGLPTDVEETGTARICGYLVAFTDVEGSVAGA